MNRQYVLALILPLLLVSCKEQTLSNTVLSADQNTTNQEVQLKNKITAEKLMISVVLHFEGISLAYFPNGVNHRIEDDRVLFMDLDGNEVASAKAVDKTDRPGYFVNDERIVLIHRQTKKNYEVEIEFKNLNYFDRFAHTAFSDYVESVSKELRDQKIVLTKPTSDSGYANIVSYVSDAPIQNLITNVMNFGPKRRGTYEHWFDDELKMVKTRKFNDVSVLVFDLLESMDVTSSSESHFSVDIFKSEMNDDYFIFNFVITNDLDLGAFVTTSPILALGQNCREFNKHHAILSKRIENGIHYFVSVKKGFAPECFDQNQFNGKIHVFDSKLNFLSVEF